MADRLDSMLIWWLDQHACEVIERRHKRRPQEMPKYIWDQFRDRYGRAGRGRLWADDRFGEVKVDPWPDTLMGQTLAMGFGGIVIAAGDREHIADMPGVVTDFNLRRA